MGCRGQDVPLLCLLASVSACMGLSAAAGGRPLSGITLGMPRADVWKHIGKPAEVRLLRFRGQSYAWDNWQDGHRRETVISRRGRVVQVEHRITSDDRSVGTFLSLRRQHPHLRVRLYDLQEEVGCVLIADDARRGAAWTLFIHHRDDPGIHIFNVIGPSMVIRHRPGRAALPDPAEAPDEHGPLADDLRA